jgi:hypothetical protein
MATKKNITSKLPSTEKRPFSCTPAQQAAALRFLERTIGIQRIIGPHNAQSGHDDILGQINDEYHSSVDWFLRQRNRIGDAKEKPLTARLLNGGPGLILHIDDVLKNGVLAEQANSEDYLFAVNGPNAVAYEVEKKGKSKYALRVFVDYGLADDDSWSAWQLIDVQTGPSWCAEFQCPCCERMVRELFNSYMACKFGCVECITILDPREADMYQRTLKAAGKKGRVA